LFFNIAFFREYERTFEQNEDLGINDMRLENYDDGPSTASSSSSSSSSLSTDAESVASLSLSSSSDSAPSSQ
jgi:hypothetical protein